MSITNFEYDFYLCNTSYPYTNKGCLTNCISSVNYNRQLRNVDQLSFIINDRHIDGTTNDLFTEITENNVIEVNIRINDSIVETNLLYITNINLVKDVREKKEIEAFSLEKRMDKQSVRGFTHTCQLYTGTWDSEDLPNSGIVDYLLTLFYSNWTVDYVSSSLTGIDIDWDIPEAKTLEVVKIIEQNLNCIFIFNTDTQTIDILSYDDDYNDFGVNTGAILASENYVEQYKSNIDVEEIITRLYVEGLDDVTIAGVNITGQVYKDDFSYFMANGDMSSGLVTALETIDSLISSNQATYDGHVSDLSTYNSELLALQGELVILQGELQVLEDSQDLAVINGGTYDGKTYAQWTSDITSKQGEITSKNAEITAKQGQITSTNASIDAINTLVSYDSNLTSAQLKELSDYIQEDTIRINSDDEEVLYDLATSYLSLKSQTQYDIEVDLIDVFKCNNESYIWQKLNIGSKVNLIIGDQTFEPFITSISHGIDNNSLNAVISNKNYFNDDLNYLTTKWSKSNQTSTTIDNKKEDWNDAKTKADVAYDFTIAPIDVNTNVINIGDESEAVQQAQINRRGIYMRSSETANGQLRILADSIVATNDNWASYSLAIDSNGIKTSGTFKLITEDTYGGSNLVTIDGNGIKIYGSESAGEGLIIYNKTDTEVFSLDTSGNIVMTGSITITGGSGIAELTDAGDCATANDLDDIDDGTTHKKTTLTEKLGGGYGYTGLNSNGRLVTQVIPAENVVTGDAGLYLGQDYLGYWSGSAWKSYMDSSGNFYLSGTETDELGWDGSTLTIRGSLVADDIVAGGTLSSVTLSSNTITGGTITIGTGNNVFKADTNGIYLGNATFASAPFRVTPAGAVTSTDISITGGSLTSSSISSSTIVGSTIKTASTGNTRIELTNGDEFITYNSSDQKHGLYINPNSYVDLLLYKAGSEFFRIFDDGVGGMSLKCYTNTFLRYTAGATQEAYIEGDWVGASGSNLNLASTDVTLNMSNVTLSGTMDVSSITYSGTKKIHVGTSAPADVSGGTIWIDTN